MEELWYQMAWEALERGGLTSYENSKEATMVIIRAFTLILMYQEFCEICYDQECFYDFSDIDTYDEINQFRLGQIVQSDYGNEYDDMDDHKAMERAFMELIQDQRLGVYDSLEANIDDGGMCTIYAAMVLATNLPFDNEKPCDITDDVYRKRVYQYVDDYGGPLYSSLSTKEDEVMQWLSAATYR